MQLFFPEVKWSIEGVLPINLKESKNDKANRMCTSQKDFLQPGNLVVFLLITVFIILGSFPL